MNPRVAKLAAGALAVFGTLFVLVILTWSSKPNQKARAKLPFINVKDLAAGQVTHLDTDSLRYFVVRPVAGKIHVVAVPTEQSTVLLPDSHWWKPFMNCKDFGLDEVDGNITSNSRFRCRDAEQPEAWVQRWQWDLYGKHIVSAGDSAIDNMYRVRFEQVGNEIFFTGLELD
jgi:hypothetical protein